MAGNTFGHLLRLTSFGESHGPLIGGVIDGFPSGLLIDFGKVRTVMQRRKPGIGQFQTQRNEEDIPEFISGIYEGKTTGAPVAFLIANKDQRPADYKELEGVYRPSHGGYTWDAKFGFHDPRGGGRSSARETAVRVAAGALAQQLLERLEQLPWQLHWRTLDYQVKDYPQAELQLELETVSEYDSYLKI